MVRSFSCLTAYFANLLSTGNLSKFTKSRTGEGHSPVLLQYSAEHNTADRVIISVFFFLHTFYNKFKT